ncbi:MAG: crossover junction endodeoxyribonuclease RuvC [Candidatus Hinthialibacter antarcticus]|nr:crossover junction endodeoxyribonuclease RuvC [Candidatus Hinthialibacter antarcticus]
MITVPPLRILGIDPGLRFTGFGVVDAVNRQAKLVEYGVITTTSDAPLPERLKIIHDGVAAVIEKHQPDRMVFEKLVYCKNVSIALLLGQARAAAILAGAQQAMPMDEYSPAEIKQAVVGKGRASKEQVQKMVRLLLSLAETPEPDHAADALAAALTYIHSKPVHDLLQRARK